MFSDTDCPFNCVDKDCIPMPDTQEHLLVCEQLANLVNSAIKYEDIFSKNCVKMKEAVDMFTKLLDARTNQLNQTNESIAGPKHRTLSSAVVA